MSQIIYPISVADYKADGFIERARLITEYQASEVRGSLEEFIHEWTINIVDTYFQSKLTIITKDPFIVK